MAFAVGLISLLRTLLILVGVFFTFRLIFRVLIPFLLKRFIKKQQENYYRNYNNNSSVSENFKRGEVHIKEKKKSKSTYGNIGDYVDYEEISEEDK